jgi:hypothetical protein
MSTEVFEEFAVSVFKLYLKKLRYQDSPELWDSSARLHGVISMKTVIFTDTTVRTPNSLVIPDECTVFLEDGESSCL